jgi:5-methylcytosine-specific restriction protein A
MTQTTERLRGRKAVDQRRQRLRRHQGLCWRCIGVERWEGKGLGRVTVATVVNHIIPLAHGGSDKDENTENLCGECDRAVTAEQFGHKPKVAIGRDGWPVDPLNGSARFPAKGSQQE